MNELDRHIGSRLRGRRVRLRRSIGNVAFRAGIDDATLQAFEDGRLRVPAVDMIKLCDVLEIRPLDIFRGYPPSEDPEPVERAGPLLILPDPTDPSPA